MSFNTLQFFSSRQHPVATSTGAGALVPPFPSFSVQSFNQTTSSTSMAGSVRRAGPLSPLVKGHLPVLLAETLELLAPQARGRYLDGTFGGGGHARAILQAAPGAHLTGIDRDPDAALRAESLKADYAGSFRFLAANFAQLSELTAAGGGLAGEQFDGILLDLGVSSFHFDTPERGFSFRHDGPLDMRMDPASGQPASAFLQNATRPELIQAVRNLGEEPRWQAVVKAIEQARGTEALTRTAPFAALIEKALYRPGPPARIHPATRTFQGIRMAVNGELEALEAVLPAAFRALSEGGVLAIISFHSLEDRLVKRTFRRLAGQAESRHDHRPAQLRPRFATILTPRPITAAEEELTRNPRARSAKLRALRKETPA